MDTLIYSTILILLLFFVFFIIYKIIKFKFKVLDSYEKELLSSFVAYSKYDIDEFELFDQLEAVQIRMNFSDRQMRKKLKRIVDEFPRYMPSSVIISCEKVLFKIIN